MTAPLPPLLLRGDCLAELARIPDESVDSVVTDPPYNLTARKKGGTGTASINLDSPYGRSRIGTGNGGGGFMGKGWDDYDAFGTPEGGGFQHWCELWSRECLRILKPGGHMLAFGGSRTWHRLAAGIEDAGFEIRDSIAWLYGSGFPKSHNVGVAIDKMLGAERGDVYAEKERVMDNEVYGKGLGVAKLASVPGSDAAREWEGWGTALKPAFEPVVVARKPLGEKTVAANVLAHGTGALNIDATRIETEERHNASSGNTSVVGLGTSWNATETGGRDALGRWPANVALDESQAAALDEQSGTKMSRGHTPRARKGASVDAVYGLGHGGQAAIVETHAEEIGGASRFFYVAPIDELEERFFYVAKAPKSERPVVGGTSHPTVKPLALMRWLIRLVTPPGGVVVDPFAGSGTTLEAAYLEGFESIGVEMTPEYWPLIAARIERVTR